MTVSNVSALLTILFALQAGSPTDLARHGTATAYVKKVFDGDTILAVIKGKKRKVRLLGIDTPEKDGPYTREEPFGKEATRRAVRLVEEKTVTLVFGEKRKKDRFGRLLAYVLLPNGKSLNEILLNEGLAEVYRNGKHPLKKRYRQIAKEAQKRCKGLWRLKKPCANR